MDMTKMFSLTPTFFFCLIFMPIHKDLGGIWRAGRKKKTGLNNGSLFSPLSGLPASISLTSHSLKNCSEGNTRCQAAGYSAAFIWNQCLLLSAAWCAWFSGLIWLVAKFFRHRRYTGDEPHRSGGLLINFDHLRISNMHRNLNTQSFSHFSLPVI